MIIVLKALNNFGDNVQQLFLKSEKITKKVFDSETAASLPEPARRYFLHVLTEGQPYISYARLRHTGRFKTGIGKPWVKIKGEQYFTCKNPGFIWIGQTKFFTAIDSFIAGRGSLKVYLFSIFRIENGQGERFSQGELLRWLAEAVWFPTSLLPNDNLQWESIDEYHAKLIYTLKNLTVSYTVTFNESFEIEMLEAERYMDGERLERWKGKFLDYIIMHNIRIPATIQASWVLQDKDHDYAVFYLSEIDYNRAYQFAK